MAQNNDEFDLDALSQVTGGRNYLTPEEEVKIYSQFSKENAKDIIELTNHKRALEEIQKENQKTGGRNM